MTDWRKLATEAAEAINAAPRDSSDRPEPGGPAVPGAIEAAEERLGAALPEDYRSFLAAVDGWRGCLFDVDLFDSAALGADPEPGGAVEGFLADYLPELSEREIEKIFGGSRSNALPIGASREEGSVVLVGRVGTPIAGRVIEFTGDDIGYFGSMEQFFRDRIDTARYLAGKARRS
jgi:hypothetical protein